MAQAFTTGPGAVFVGVGANNAPVFLGHAELGVRVVIKAGWEGVKCDLAGSQIDYDRSYQGEEGELSADLTRWNESVYAALAVRYAPVLGGIIPRGRDTAPARGTLMITSGVAIPWWIAYPASALPAYSTLPGGYHFFKTWLAGPDQLEPGTKPYKIRLRWEALAEYLPSSGTFDLYDQNVAGLPAIN